MDLPPPPYGEVPQLSRQKRMNFFDLANLLDSDGNLQNEMMVFAFAATMLSTIPVLLGNEFDINVGLKRKKRSSSDEELDNTSSYVFYDDGHSKYYAYGPSDSNQQSSVNSTGSLNPCCKFNTRTNPFGNDLNQGPSQSQSNNCCTASKQQQVVSLQENEIDDGAPISNLLYELLKWANVKTKAKPLLPLLMNLALDRYNGNSNPADALVKQSYKTWKTFW
ncbi:unnamed protein product [Meganyctiphanes norvegica]|uniref:Uncharacterized protein n=1 Tax=Meganyctiphanes norvegica TaxID=48144 RepID=A0AAV2R2I9_MEGNR